MLPKAHEFDRQPLARSYVAQELHRRAMRVGGVVHERNLLISCFSCKTILGRLSPD